MKKSFRLSILSDKSVDGVEFSMAFLKRAMYHESEYWYIGSMLHNSDTLKNKQDECTATGVYPVQHRVSERQNKS